MPLNVKDTGSGQDFDPVPQGTHAAVCYLVADIGLQPTSYGPKHKVVIGFEIPDQIIEYKDKDGNTVKKPMIINNFYTASLSSKAILTGDLDLELQCEYLHHKYHELHFLSFLNNMSFQLSDIKEVQYG